MTSLTRASQLNPQLGGAHLFLGIAEYQLGEVGKAVSSLHAELVLDPDSIEAATWLTLVLVNSDRAEEAAPVIDHAAQLKPTDPQLLYLQAKTHGLLVKKALSRLYQLDPDSALVHQATAESLDGAGQPEKAIAEFQEALKKEPTNTELLDELGLEYEKVSRFEEAMGVFEKECSLNPSSAVALYNLGKIDVERGKPAEGVALLQRAQEAHATASPTAFYLGLGLAETGKNAEAAHWLEISVQDRPTPFIAKSAWYQLARVYQKLNRPEDAKRALTHLQEVVDQQTGTDEAKAGAAQKPVPGGAPPTPVSPQ